MEHGHKKIFDFFMAEPPCHKKKNIQDHGLGPPSWKEGGDPGGKHIPLRRGIRLAGLGME